MIFLVILLLIPIGVSADTLVENQSRIGTFTGDVGLLTQGAADWIEPHEGLPIEPGDRIRTGEDGVIELEMSQNALWILEPLSEVEFEHTETNSGRLNLVGGTLLGRLDSSQTAGTVQRWEFNTPNMIVTIRGTEFALDFSKNISRLGVFEGEIELQGAETAEGFPPQMLVSTGQEALAQRGKAVVTLKKWDAPMQALLSKRKILRLRQTQLQDTWTPFTPEVRALIRNKFVAPAPKRRPMVPHPRHRSTSPPPE